MGQGDWIDLSGNEIQDCEAIEELVARGVQVIGVECESEIEGLGELCTVTFSDSNLEISVQEALGLASAPFLSCERAQELESLDAAARNIVNLKGLETLEGLSVLDLSGNSIRNIRPIVWNPGLGTGDFVDLRSNPLQENSCDELEKLADRGVEVLHDVECDIENPDTGDDEDEGETSGDEEGGDFGARGSSEDDEEDNSGSGNSGNGNSGSGGNSGNGNGNSGNGNSGSGGNSGNGNGNSGYEDNDDDSGNDAGWEQFQEWLRRLRERVGKGNSGNEAGSGSGSSGSYDDDDDD